MQLLRCRADRQTGRQTGRRVGGNRRQNDRQANRQTGTGATPEEALRQRSQPLLQVRRHLSEVIMLVADDTQQVSQAAAMVLPILAQIGNHLRLQGISPTCPSYCVLTNSFKLLQQSLVNLEKANTMARAVMTRQVTLAF